MLKSSKIGLRASRNNLGFGSDANCILVDSQQVYLHRLNRQLQFPFKMCSQDWW